MNLRQSVLVTSFCGTLFMNFASLYWNMWSVASISIFVLMITDFMFFEVRWIHTWRTCTCMCMRTCIAVSSSRATLRHARASLHVSVAPASCSDRYLLTHDPHLPLASFDVSALAGQRVLAMSRTLSSGESYSSMHVLRQRRPPSASHPATWKEQTVGEPVGAGASQSLSLAATKHATGHTMRRY